MKRLTNAWEPALIAAMMLLASVCAQAQAQDANVDANNVEAEEGKVVQIAPADGADNLEVAVDDLEVETRVVEAGGYWIGIRGRSIESHILRTHLQLAEDMGVVVEDVLEGSPAEKAGLRKHDIILRCNGDAVDNMDVLKSQVTNGKEKPLELQIIRLGKKETLVVVPEQRPELVDERVNQFGPLPRFGDIRGEAMQKLMAQLGARNIGPGMVFRGGGRGLDLNAVPNGVSISILRNNDEPAQILVNKGDQSWRISSDDKESLRQLPDDVRPFVERMINGQEQAPNFGGGFDFGDFNVEVEQFLPRGLGGIEPQMHERLQRQLKMQEEQLELRMKQMEKRMQQMQERLEAQQTELPTS